MKTKKTKPQITVQYPNGETIIVPIINNRYSIINPLTGEEIKARSIETTICGAIFIISAFVPLVAHIPVLASGVVLYAAATFITVKKHKKAIANAPSLHDLYTDDEIREMVKAEIDSSDE